MRSTTATATSHPAWKDLTKGKSSLPHHFQTPPGEIRAAFLFIVIKEISLSDLLDDLLDQVSGNIQFTKRSAHLLLLSNLTKHSDRECPSDR